MKDGGEYRLRVSPLGAAEVGPSRARSYTCRCSESSTGLLSQNIVGPRVAENQIALGLPARLPHE